MDRSPKNSWMPASTNPQTPDKTNFRLKKLQRQVNQYRGEISVKNEQIQYLNQRNSQLIQGKLTTSMKPSQNIYEASLEDQIQRLNLKLADKSKQYERLYQKYSALQNQMAILEDFTTDLDRQRKFLADKLANIQIHTEGDQVVGELQNKLVLMSTEIMRLGQLNRNKTQQNSDLKFKLKQKTQEKQLIQNQLLQKQKTISQYRERIRMIQRKLQQIESNKQYQNQSTYKILSTEIQRLNIQLHNKMEQINTLQHKNRILQQKQLNLSNSNLRINNYTDLQIEVQRLNKIINTNNQQLSQIEGNFKRIKKENNQITEDNERYRRLVKKLEQELQQTRKSYIKDQNQKIRIQIQTSERTIREQRNIIEKLQTQSQAQYEQNQKQLRKKFQDELNTIKMMHNQSQNKCLALTADLRRYEEKLVMLSQQIQRLSLQNTKYQEQNAELKRLQYKIQTKERQIKQIIRVRQVTDMEIKRDKQTIERLRLQIREVNDKNKQIQAKQYKLTSLKNEYQIIQDKLLNKQNQCRILQQKLREQNELVTNNYRIIDLQSQLQSQRKNFRIKQEEGAQYYEKQIVHLKDFISKLELRVRDLSSEQSSNQSNYVILADQIRRLNEVLSQSSQTILSQKRQINLLQNNLQTAEKSIQKMKTLYISNQRVEAQIQTRTQVYNKQIKLHLQQISNLKLKIQQIIANSASNQQQLHNYRLMLQDTKQNLKNKQQELRNLLDDIKRSKQSQDNLIVLIKDIKQSNARLERKLAEIQQDYIRRLQEKSNEKQKLQNQYIQYNRKIRQAQTDSNDLKFEVSSLRSKLQILTKRERQLQLQNERLQNKLSDQIREKSNNIKMTTDEYQNKIHDYEQQSRKNARYIGQLESDLKNKNEQLYKVESTIRQLEDEKYRIQNQNKGYEQQKKREYELKNQQFRINAQRKQQQLANLKEQIEQLKEQIRSKQKIIQQKSQLIHDYENKLAMLSQELERINVLIYQKQTKIQQLQSQINNTQKSFSKQNKDTMQILSAEISRLNSMLCDSLQQTKQFQLQLNNKNRQIKRNAQLTKKNEQTLKDKLFELEQQAEKLMRQNNRLSANIGVFGKKIEDYQKMEKQNEQLKSRVIDANSQKTKLKNTITDLQSQIQTLKFSYENNLQQQHNSLNSKATIKVNQIEQNRRQLQRKVNIIVSQNQQLVLQIQKLKRQLDLIDKQNSQNKRQLIRSKNQIVNLAREKQKYRIMSQQVMNKVEHITINKTMNMTTMENNEKDAYEYRIKNLEGTIMEYENQIKILKQQIDKTSNRERSRENSSVASSNVRPASKSGHQDLQQKYNILESLHLKLKRQADGWREKVTEYQFKMKKLKGQFDLINKLIHQYKDENEYLRQNNHTQCVYVGKTMQNQAISMPSSAARQQAVINKNQQLLVKQTLASQIDRLGILNANLRRQIQDLRLQAVDNQSIKLRYEELMTTFVIMAVQIQALRKK